MASFEEDDNLQISDEGQKKDTGDIDTLSSLVDDKLHIAEGSINEASTQCLLKGFRALQNQSDRLHLRVSSKQPPPVSNPDETEFLDAQAHFLNEGTKDHCLPRPGPSVRQCIYFQQRARMRLLEWWVDFS